VSVGGWSTVRGESFWKNRQLRGIGRIATKCG